MLDGSLLTGKQCTQCTLPWFMKSRVCAAFLPWRCSCSISGRLGEWAAWRWGSRPRKARRCPCGRTAPSPSCWRWQKPRGAQVSDWLPARTPGCEGRCQRRFAPEPNADNPPLNSTYTLLILRQWKDRWNSLSGNKSSSNKFKILNPFSNFRSGWLLDCSLSFVLKRGNFPEIETSWKSVGFVLLLYYPRHWGCFSAPFTTQVLSIGSLVPSPLVHSHGRKEPTSSPRWTEAGEWE